MVLVTVFTRNIQLFIDSDEYGCEWYLNKETGQIKAIYEYGEFESSESDNAYFRTLLQPYVATVCVYNNTNVTHSWSGLT